LEIITNEHNEYKIKLADTHTTKLENTSLRNKIKELTDQNIELIESNIELKEFEEIN